MSEETTPEVTEETVEEVTEEPTPFMKRFLALEHQSYIMYLQLNALTALLVNGEVVDKDKLVASMDEMNLEIQKITEEIDKEGAAE
jgi:hypothetical protein